jgi:hypothetical protein
MLLLGINKQRDLQSLFTTSKQRINKRRRRRTTQHDKKPDQEQDKDDGRQPPLLIMQQEISELTQQADVPRFRFLLKFAAGLLLVFP